MRSADEGTLYADDGDSGGLELLDCKLVTICTLLHHILGGGRIRLNRQGRK